MTVDGRAAANLPKIPSPSLKSQENLIFLDRQKNPPPNSMAANFAETTPAVALTRTLLSQGEEGG